MTHELRALRVPQGLQPWLDLLGSSTAALRRAFPRSRFHFEANTSYALLSGVSEMSNKQALFYFQSDELILIHIHAASILNDLNANNLLAELDKPLASLASRAGKGFLQHIYPLHGLAFSSDTSGQLAFIEVFRPLPLEDYLSTIYLDPGHFVM